MMDDKNDKKDDLEKRVDRPSRSQDAGGACVGSTVPGWIRGKDLWKTLDAKELVREGGNLRQVVLDDLKGLPEGQMYLVISPEAFGDFPNAARDDGFKVHTDETLPGIFKAYIAR
jgi:hypothetical protein